MKQNHTDSQKMI